jgi:hypothetical protein
VIDVEIAGHPNRTLIDTGANACFVSDAFCSKTLLRYDRSKYTAASLANKSTACIRGATAPVSLSIQSFTALAVLQVLDNPDGVDAILGLNFLRAHSISVHPESLSIPIPSPTGIVTVKSAPQEPAYSNFSSAYVEVVSGARLAKVIAHEDSDIFLGNIKYLSFSSTADSTPLASAQPAEYAPL